jgi:hypothetical protein
LHTFSDRTPNKDYRGALPPDYADEEKIQCKEMAFHLINWRSDAAFLVALHLFPERFTQEEIATGIDMFLVHAPAHVIAAARLSGNSTSDVFAENDGGSHG